jgi:hypothetical protein
MKPGRRQQWHSSIIIAIIVIIIIQVPPTLPHSTAQLSTLLPSHGEQKCAFQPAASSFPTPPLHVSHVPHYVVLTRRNLPTSRQDMRARLLARPLRSPLARHRTSPRIYPSRCPSQRPASFLPPPTVSPGGITVAIQRACRPAPCRLCSRASLAPGFLGLVSTAARSGLITAVHDFRSRRPLGAAR